MGDWADERAAEWLERLPARIASKIRPSDDGCWIWEGSTRRKGYGRTWDSRLRKEVAVHRLVYESLVGPIHDGLTIDHLCRVRRCVNPRHLEPVTIRQNILRGEGPAAQNTKKDVCPKCRAAYGRDHHRSYWRRCVTCTRESAKQRYYAAQAKDRT